MPDILHISYDIRNQAGKESTVAVSNLINLNTDGNVNRIIDIKRTTDFFNQKLWQVNKNHIAIDSFGLPFGILLIRTLKSVLNKIKKAAAKNLIDIQSVDLIHAHKLTFEGYIGYKLGRIFNKPLAITIRQTDTAVLFYKPYLKFVFKKILKFSTVVFYVNPYSKLLLKKRTGAYFFDSVLRDKMVLLPNIVERKEIKSNNSITKGSYFLTILRMDRRSVIRKNIKRLLKAFAQIENIKLLIIGSGDYEMVVKSWTQKLGISDRVKFLGKIPNEEIDVYYQSAIAFLLPSHSETFGLVYAEALLNGVPILYSKDRLGFDGFFESVGPKVNPRSVESIKSGILECINKEDFYKKQIKKLSTMGEFEIFNRENIKDTYYNSLLKFNLLNN